MAVTTGNGIISDGLKCLHGSQLGLFTTHLETCNLTIFSHFQGIAENGEITGFKMRCEQSKLTTVKALQSIGYDTIASGDSHNDLGMIQASKAGFLFRSTDAIKKDYPELPAYETYDELLAAIKAAL